jgi:hypothetical protein
MYDLHTRKKWPRDRVHRASADPLAPTLTHVVDQTPTELYVSTMSYCLGVKRKIVKKQ